MKDVILVKKQTPIEIALDIDDTGHTTARKLYKWLELRPGDYARWIKVNITENAYAEAGIDYSAFVRSDCEGRGNYAQDYSISASFAKKLAMTSRSPKGEETREYFIRVEDALVKVSQKPMTPAEALLQNVQLLVEQERRINAVEADQEEMKRDIARIDAKITNRPDDWFTIVGWARLHNVRVSLQEAKTMGKRAARYCRDNSINISTVNDERYGKVNVYPEHVLNRLFLSLDSDSEEFM